MAFPIPKPPQKPIAPPKYATGSESLKEMKWQMKQEAIKGKLVIPGTGGQRMTGKQVEDIFKQPRFSYGKVKTNLDRPEKIRILKQLRSEDGGGMPSRERRIFEEKWGLKSARGDY